MVQLTSVMAKMVVVMLKVNKITKMMLLMMKMMVMVMMLVVKITWLVNSQSVMTPQEVSGPTNISGALRQNFAKYFNSFTKGSIISTENHHQELKITQIKIVIERNTMIDVQQILQSAREKVRMESSSTWTYYISFLSGYGNLDNRCRDPMNNNKDCRVGQLTSISGDPLRATCDPSDFL